MNRNRYDFLVKALENYRVDIYTSVVTNKRTGKVVKQHSDGRGYLQFGISFGGQSFTYKVHEVVAVSGSLNLLDGTLNHMDGNKRNNCITNFEVVTREENASHAHRIGLIPNAGKHGRHQKGQVHHKARLTDEDVRKIRSLYESRTYKQQELADMFGINNQHVSCIINRKRWKHVV